MLTQTVVARASLTWCVQLAGLPYMVTYQLREIKHKDLLSSPKHWPQFRVCIDHAPVLGILQIVLFNIVPEAFSNLDAWQRCVANNSSQFCTWLYCFHQPMGLGPLSSSLLFATPFCSRHDVLPYHVHS